MILYLAHPPAEVWRTFTEPALLAQWLLPVVNDKQQLARAIAAELLLFVDLQLASGENARGQFVYWLVVVVVCVLTWPRITF